MAEPPLIPTSPTTPDLAVTAERLATLKQRLQAISVKHTNRRGSQDSLTLKRSSSGSSVADSMERAETEPERMSVGSRLSTASLDSTKVDTLPDGETPAQPPPPQPDPACTCGTVINQDRPQFCNSCGGMIEPIARIELERAQLANQLSELQRKLHTMEQRQDASTHEMSLLRTRVQEMEEALATKERELSSVKADLDRIGQKLIDEVEVRAELQHSKDAVQEELEELTKSLFEEANSMVATEARQRYEYQKREQALKQQLDEVMAQLQMERDQLKELRTRMEDMEHQQVPSSSDSTEYNPRLSVNSSASFEKDNGAENPPAEQAIDPVLLAEFEEFVTASPDTRWSKLHTLHFMKNALEDDVSPCLRFGGNPRTSTKKLLDAIAANTCLVEEMSAAQIAALEARSSRFDRSSTASPRPSTSPSRSDGSSKKGHDPTPDVVDLAIPVAVPAGHSKTAPSTQAIFNKTVMERLSSAFSSGSLQLGSSSTNHASVGPNGCSACGRSAIQPSSSSQTPPPVRFQFKTSDAPDDIWNPICVQCRDRLVAVCEFYNFVRHIRQGLYTTRRREDLYLEMLNLKRRMFYARIGASKFAEGDKPFFKKRTRPNSSVPGSASEVLANRPGDITPPPTTGASIPKLSFSPLFKRRSAASVNSVDSPKSPVDSNGSLGAIADTPGAEVQEHVGDEVGKSDESTSPNNPGMMAMMIK